MAVVYTSQDLAASTLPERQLVTPAGSHGAILTNNGVWDLSVFSPLFNLTVPSYSTLTCPVAGNLQITVKGLSKDPSLLVVSNTAVTWGTSSVAVPLNVTPIASKAVTTINVSGDVNATITDSAVTLDSNVVNALLLENPGILFGSASQSVTNLAVGGSVTFPVTGPLGNYDGAQCVIVSGSGYTTYNLNVTPYISRGLIGAGAYVASSSAAGDTTTTQATGTAGVAIQSYQLFVNPAFTNSINVTVINNGTVAVTDTFTVYVFARMSAAIRMGGNIVTVAHLAGITNYATASYSYASVGLGGWTILFANSTNEAAHVVPNFGWTHAAGFASAIGGPNYTVDTAYISVPAGQSQSFTNLPVGARWLNIVVSWPTAPTSGSYEFEILEYAG
jgi:hypothetical protein